MIPGAKSKMEKNGETGRSSFGVNKVLLLKPTNHDIYQKQVHIDAKIRQLWIQEKRTYPLKIGKEKRRAVILGDSFKFGRGVELFRIFAAYLEQS